MARKLFLTIFLFHVTIITVSEAAGSFNLSLTIGAQKRQLEVSWTGARLQPGDLILVTKKEPVSFKKFTVGSVLNVQTTGVNEGSGDDGVGLGLGELQLKSADYWTYNDEFDEVPIVITPTVNNDWVQTNLVFEQGLLQYVDSYTKCYAFWVSYVTSNGEILKTNCISAFPRWMNEMKSKIENFRIRDLMIPGSHDSGSYFKGYGLVEPQGIVTKYSVTQDENVRNQLLHGIRYLDIRIGYYGTTPEKFWVNHGISRQQPLADIIDQVRSFVLETNEIVIFDVQEFPIGFGKELDIHRLLVKYLRDQFGDLLVDPSLTWQARLKEIWYRKSNVILSYDYPAVVNEFPTTLFPSADQRWGNVIDWSSLERFLIRSNQQAISRFSSRPVADMAELTPDTWGVILDKYGGLRKMADDVNQQLSLLYQNDLGHSANIVAVDFYRGTTIVETALYWNSQRVPTR